MIKVILTKGLPGSGKSTWAKQVIDENFNSYKRINKDELRLMLDNGKHSNDAEKFVLQVRDAIMLAAINDGKHVIIDDTNLASKHEKHIRELVKGIAEVEIKDFTDVAIEICIKQDLKRMASVGESVIRKNFDQYLRKRQEYKENPTLTPAIIVDIDGTLAKMNGRSPFDWSKVKEDSCNEVVRGLVNAYPGKVIIFSGRDGICKTDTIEWLNSNHISYNDLFMRDIGNIEKDAIIKRRMFEQHIRGKYFIDYVLDDRNQVVEMWRDLGLTCLQVADGNF